MVTIFTAPFFGAAKTWCKTHLLVMSGPAVLAELRSKMELICDMTILLPMHAIPA
jgi:hypothetical protein